MTSPANAPKVLRIGVIQGDKVIEERILRDRGTVTFGTGEGNTFVFAGSDLPRSVAVFEPKGAEYQMVFTDQNECRVENTAAKEKLDFGALKQKAERAGQRYRYTIADTCRGRVKLTPEVTVLFHFVAPPPAAPKVELPEDMQQGLLKSVEPVFTSVLLASLLVHVGVGIAVSVIEPPKPTIEDLRKVIERIAPPKVEVPKVPTKTDSGPAIAEGPGKGKKEDDEPKAPSGGDGDGGDGGEPKGGGSKGKGGGGSGGIGDRTALREQIAGKGILQLIGGRGGGGGGGAVGSVFGAGAAISDDVGAALRGTAGVGIAGAGGGGDVTRRGTGGGGAGGAGGGEGGGAADIGSLATSGGGAVDTGSKQAVRVVARVSADDVEAVDGKIDKKTVSATIRRRQDAFQACYETALKANSKLQGKLVVEFTIDETGKVSDARVVKDGLNSAEVSTCVIATLKRVRFPAPEDGEVTISNSFVFQPGA